MNHRSKSLVPCQLHAHETWFNTTWAQPTLLECLLTCPGLLLKGMSGGYELPGVSQSTFKMSEIV